ncbi:uncharacterized protein LOC117900871 [Drosophila subobscura]|uniref:uncharacterized protein LOC117900871 n=1 Tax=Drosophila subobscura TaxID=7241 RepID=UPI00155AC216|nr:uncharacterized protein LOC117900871 [Drosophila subobscura]
MRVHLLILAVLINFVATKDEIKCDKLCDNKKPRLESYCAYVPLYKCWNVIPTKCNVEMKKCLNRKLKQPDEKFLSGHCTNLKKKPLCKVREYNISWNFNSE